MNNSKVPKIIYEDKDIIIVDKPAGMIVNNADTSKDLYTLQDWVVDKLRIKNELGIKEDSDFHKRVGIVHRLDKDTSGLVIIAKSEDAFKNLQSQFKKGEVEKTYIALVHGKVIPSSGEINVPIGRLPWNRMRFGVLPEGRESKTLYKVISHKNLKDKSRVEEFSLIEVSPKTGRTHQIRVHFRYIGFPIVGDLLYSGRKNIRRFKKLINRHFLHAQKISFYHPTTQKKVAFKSGLPSELIDFVELLD